MDARGDRTVGDRRLRVATPSRDGLTHSKGKNENAPAQRFGPGEGPILMPSPRRVCDRPFCRPAFLNAVADHRVAYPRARIAGPFGNRLCFAEGMDEAWLFPRRRRGLEPRAVATSRAERICLRGIGGPLPKRTASSIPRRRCAPRPSPSGQFSWPPPASSPC